ncbi:MAG: ATP-binding protein [Deltaproteobacteria bacterium]|nr:ATP-binding protein [Deltaproteobacteria bacterium]MBI2342163.1 ATP-binding protein [Deltaproteobacteria bacterium]MBI2974555.1 ATP-binding protein [Deltaproteobacteria bacterium]
MKIERLIHELIKDSLLSDKMILLAGPRQTGKTTEAKEWLHETGHSSLYYNWDDEKVRRKFRADPNFFETAARTSGKGSRIVFDEIHKITNWKNLLKGYYDSFGSEFNFLVTGSARLELFQRSGDSMLGRYHLLHMAPVTPNELECVLPKPNTKLDINFEVFSSVSLKQSTLDALINYSGFPEPLIKQSDRALNLWHEEYNQRIIREDLRDLSKISDFNRVEHAIELLPARIGSPFSLNNLKTDIGCAYDTARSLIKALEKLYIITVVRPYSKNIKYALSKEPKVYFYDWTRVKDAGGRFENFMAIQLKTFCEFINDGGWQKVELYYLRDKQRHEVDFLIASDGEPRLLIEAKNADSNLDANLKFFSERSGNVPAVQVVFQPDIFKMISKKVCIVSANRFFNLLWNF